MRLNHISSGVLPMNETNGTPGKVRRNGMVEHSASTNSMSEVRSKGGAYCEKMPVILSLSESYCVVKPAPPYLLNKRLTNHTPAATKPNTPATSARSCKA